jgi:hypothetical protein
VAVDVLRQFDQALLSPEPTLALRSAVSSLLAHGWEGDNLLKTLEDYRQSLQRAGRADAEDVVLEVMDFLAGWASPHMTL